MYHRKSKRTEHIRQVAIYVLMASMIFVIVTLFTLFMLGFRFDADKGKVEQYSFLQFSSTPSGATVLIDGSLINSKTPNKSTVSPGKHEVTMWRDGYEKWHKAVDLKAGTLTWLNYTLLVPTKLTLQPVAGYDSLYKSLASPNGDFMLVQKQSNTPSFELVDLSSDTIKSVSLTIPSPAYSEQNAIGIGHTFGIEKWDSGSRFVLVSHKYGEKLEWLVLDTQNVTSTKNITRTFDLPISNIAFSGTSGNIFYCISSGDIRKLDLGAGTISKSLVSSVDYFTMYEKSKVITYVGKGKVGTAERVAGIYRDGDDGPAVIRTVKSAADVPLNISTTRYFNENFIAISEGKKIDILSGSYPNTTSDNANNMKLFASFNINESVNELSFSPSGEFVFAQVGPYFASYDLEYQKLVSSSVDGVGAVTSLKWLDENHVWSDRDGNLTIREYDGADVHTINSSIIGQDATLTNNGRYIYSIGKSKTGYQLQRVRMILP